MLCYGLINNHAFIDGNKRIGILAMLTFLEINGIEVECTDEKLVGLGLDTASGVLKTGDIKKWITEHTEK